MSGARRYLVGGAVRDALLGLAVHDRDWVWVGADPAALRAAGYRAVGRDFPVFVDPETGEEHALARTERKRGRGYRGFVVDTGPEVTLEADLARRDLTINAMARDADDRLIDPYGGQRDLEAGVLRHVSAAFVEDPVRLLRVARYAARFAALGFGIAPETQDLLAAMVADGEVDHLVAERVRAETERALAGPEPAVFFYVLRRCGALATLFPELAALFGVPQPVRHHSEVDAGVHTLLVLDQAARAGASMPARYAALCHDYGKALTPAASLPGHPGHERAGTAPAERCSARLRAPKAWAEAARLAARWHTHLHRFAGLRAATIVGLFEAIDALRRPERLDDLLAVCAADVRGRLGLENRPYPQAEAARRALAAARNVDAGAIAAGAGRGPQIAAAVRRARIEAVAKTQKEIT